MRDYEVKLLEKINHKKLQSDFLHKSLTIILLPSKSDRHQRACSILFKWLSTDEIYNPIRQYFIIWKNHNQMKPLAQVVSINVRAKEIRESETNIYLQSVGQQ